MSDPAICSHLQSDGYRSHYRRWGRAEGDDVIVLLHGGISHSGWQAPLAEALLATSDVSFIALDRRGSGLNEEKRGHLVSEEREIDDVTAVLRGLVPAFRRVHLAGWCFGGQVASIAAAALAGQGILTSLLLIAPGFVFCERYADVLRLSMQAVFETVEELGQKPPTDRAFVPVPLQPIDFTDDESWLRFVREDRLRLTRVSPSTVKVWGELANRSHTILGDLGGLPVLAVFGDRDRLVDNAKVRALLEEKIRPVPTFERVDAHHAIQFDAPRALAAHLTRFLSRFSPHFAVTSGELTAAPPQPRA